MKRLLDPKLSLLVASLSAEDCKELFLAILEYPDRECSVPIWPFVKVLLDEDEVKYKDKCRRLAENRMKSRVSNTNQDDITMISDATAKQESKVQIQDNTIEQSNTMRRMAADNLIKNFSNAFSPYRMCKFTIDKEFSLAEIIKRNPSLAQEFSKFSSEHLAAAQESLKRKCFGERKTITQLLGWINQEGKF